MNAIPQWREAGLGRDRRLRAGVNEWAPFPAADPTRSTTERTHPRDTSAVPSLTIRCRLPARPSGQRSIFGTKPTGAGGRPVEWTLVVTVVLVTRRDSLRKRDCNRSQLRKHTGGAANMSDRTRFAAGLIVVASGAATFAIVFRASLNLVYRTVYGADNVVSAISTLPRWTRVVVLITVAAVAGIVARLRSARAQGVSNVMEAIALGNVHLSLSTTISRVVASWTALAGGMSIGRGGPLIEFGGSLGAAVGRLFATSLNHTRVLVAAGTAAGLPPRITHPWQPSSSSSRRLSELPHRSFCCPRWRQRAAANRSPSVAEPARSPVGISAAIAEIVTRLGVPPNPFLPNWLLPDVICSQEMTT